MDHNLKIAELFSDDGVIRLGPDQTIIPHHIEEVRRDIGLIAISLRSVIEDHVDVRERFCSNLWAMRSVRDRQ